MTPEQEQQETLEALTDVFYPSQRSYVVPVLLIGCAVLLPLALIILTNTK